MSNLSGRGDPPRGRGLRGRFLVPAGKGVLQRQPGVQASLHLPVVEEGGLETLLELLPGQVHADQDELLAHVPELLLPDRLDVGAGGGVLRPLLLVHQGPPGPRGLNRGLLAGGLQERLVPGPGGEPQEALGPQDLPHERRLEEVHEARGVQRTP